MTFETGTALTAPAKTVDAESSISMDNSMDMIFENRFIKKLPSKYSAFPPIPYYIALTSFSTHKSWRCREKPEI